MTTPECGATTYRSREASLCGGSIKKSPRLTLVGSPGVVVVANFIIIVVVEDVDVNVTYITWGVSCLSW